MVSRASRDWACQYLHRKHEKFQFELTGRGEISSEKDALADLGLGGLTSPFGTRRWCIVEPSDACLLLAKRAVVRISNASSSES